LSLLVLDASVALALLLPQEHSQDVERALQPFMQADAVHVPYHWTAEVVNGLLQALRLDRIEESQARKAIAWVERAPFVFDRSPEATDVFELAQASHITAYDAIYLALTLRHDAALASLDPPLRAAARGRNLPVLP